MKYDPTHKSPDPAVMKTVEYEFNNVTNYKEFFITQDGIAGAGYETFISVFRRYQCKAGCDVCYIQDRWVDQDGNDYFSKYVPDQITEVMESRILDAFDHFQHVSTIDDTFFVKHKYPDLFEFYKRHCHRINLTSMTDMALLQQTRIAIHDLDYKAVYDITVSDTFIQPNTVFDAVVRCLEELHEKYKLTKLRVIISTDPTINRTNMIKLLTWAKHKGIYLSGSNDNQGDWFFVNELMKMVDHQETMSVVYKQELHQIYSEVTHLMLDRWVVSFYQSTQDSDESFYQLTDTFNPEKWLEALLNEKLRQYTNSRNVIVPDDNNANYVRYFNYIADNLIIHPDWNFIPKVAFNKGSGVYYNKLALTNFTDTPMGLIRTSTLTNNHPIIPIYSFRQSS